VVRAGSGNVKETPGGASNEELISASAREDIRQAVHALGMTVDNPFVLQADGSWMMPAGDDAGATFSLHFFDPTTDNPVSVDPFVLDSYLVGSASWSRTTVRSTRCKTSKSTRRSTWSMPSARPT
jgi:formylglycine-generating enzyme required for sulfatase activity